MCGFFYYFCFCGFFFFFPSELEELQSSPFLVLLGEAPTWPPDRLKKMYIKSIVLEGFKSYAQRTEIRDFDPLFNAITGLNGSGKSNILDSICFLLGISNLSQVKR